MLTVENVSRSYGELKAVDELSFRVEPGEIFGLLGPNGSGKTTTVKMILGMLDPDAGSVSVGGIDPCSDSRGVKSTVVPHRLSCAHRAPPSPDRSAVR